MTNQAVEYFVQNALFCESILQEVDGLRTIVRIFDSFILDAEEQDGDLANAPKSVQFWFVFSAKASQPVEKMLRIVWIDSEGTEAAVVESMTSTESQNPEMPGLWAQVFMNMKLHIPGMYRANVYIDDALVASSPLLVRGVLEGPKGSGE